MAERELPDTPVFSLFSPPPPLVIPLQGGKKTIKVTVRWPVTQDQWDHFMAVLEAMKPGLVKEGDGDG
jgi:hypothetical protein